MYIIPYIIKEKQSTQFKLWTAWVFMKNGIWETDREDSKKSPKEIIEEYLEPNGFFGRFVCVKDDCLLFEVDPGLTKLGDFYTWNDMLGGRGLNKDNSDMWRPFIWCGETCGGSDDWGWEEETSKVSLGKFGSVSKLWKVLCSNS
jgi:hypothetical protein